MLTCSSTRNTRWIGTVATVVLLVGLVHIANAIPAFIERNSIAKVHTDDDGNVFELYFLNTDEDRYYSRVLGQWGESGLRSYEKRADTYEKVIFTILMQTDISNADQLIMAGRVGTDIENLWALTEALGGFPAEVISQVSQFRHLRYVRGSNVAYRTLNKYKTFMRHARHSTRLRNFSAAMGAISVAMEVYQIGSNAQHLAAMFALVKALEQDLAMERYRVLRDQSDITDPAYLTALDRVGRHLDNASTDWDHLVQTMILNADEVVQIAQSSANIGISLNMMLSTHGINPAAGYLFAAAFAWEMYSLTDEHREAWRRSVLAATIYHGLSGDGETKQQISEYCEFMFCQQFRQGIDNSLTWVLSIFPSWREAIEEWTYREESQKEMILVRRVQLAAELSESISVSARQSIVFVLDTSSSMRDPTPNGTMSKIEAAKASAEIMISGLHEDSECAIVTFRGCTPVLAIGFTNDKESLLNLVRGVSCDGNTPLAAAIEYATEYMRTEASSDEQDIVLLSDGEETCNGDPIGAAEQINQNR